MSVSTLLVCDDSNKVDQLGALIQRQPQLNFTGVVASASAGKQILESSPSLVWIELAPEPAKALSLLGELKETYPTIQYVVSYDTLRADLVKSAMQLGAVEYIDPASAERLLPEAIERIQHRLNAAILGTPNPRPTGLEPSADPNYIPGGSASRSQVSGVRRTQLQLEGAPGMPIWLFPSVILALVVAILYVYFFMK